MLRNKLEMTLSLQILHFKVLLLFEFWKNILYIFSDPLGEDYIENIAEEGKKANPTVQVKHICLKVLFSEFNFPANNDL